MEIKISLHKKKFERFEIKFLSFINDKGLKEFWFNAKDVGSYFGYSSNRITKIVPRKLRKNFSEFPMFDKIPWKLNTLLLAELSILLFSSNSKARKFNEWLYLKTLSQLRFSENKNVHKSKKMSSSTNNWNKFIQNMKK